MLKIEKFVTPSPAQWMITIEGMRNAMNSWDRIDSEIITSEMKPDEHCDWVEVPCEPAFYLGNNDHDLMMHLSKSGGPHAKYRRELPVHVTLNAPLYWWKEFETYRTGVAPNPLDIDMNSCSTMHKIHAKEFTLDDFSTEHLCTPASEHLFEVMNALNAYRDMYLNWERDSKDYSEYFGDDKKNVWWQMIQLLPSSYNQKRTICLNYQVLHEMYKWRKNHKLDEWRTFCHWIEELPYSELITLYQEEEE